MKGARPDWAREMRALTILGWIVVLILILPAVIPAALAGQPFLTWQILVILVLVAFGTWKTKPWRLAKRAKPKAFEKDGPA